MIPGIKKRLLVTTALSAVFTSAALMAQLAPATAQTFDTTLMGAPEAPKRVVIPFPENFDFTMLGLPADFNPMTMDFPDGFDFTMLGFPADFDPETYDPTLMGAPKYTPAAEAILGLDPTLHGAPKTPVNAMPGFDPTLTGMPGVPNPGLGFDPTLQGAPEAPKPTLGFDPTLQGAPPTPAGMNPNAPVLPIDPVVPVDPIDPVDPDRPTDIPTAGPLPTFEGIGLSALSPPETATLTQAVQITAGPVGEQQFVQATGQTLFGAVMDPGAFDMVEVEVQPSGRISMVDVSPMTGQFATRVFEDDFGNDGSLDVTLTGMNSTNTEVSTDSVSYTLRQAMPEDGFVQALSRVTFGATPQLYARVRAIGFAAYVEEQLNPDTINDAFFDALRVDDLIDPNQRNTSRTLDELIEHDLAYAIYTEKQLREVMGTFWSNHFHASEKLANMAHQMVADRDFFRENAFGNFADLLKYSARSPVMSRFLDNTDNRRGRINENYGREILELHTVGVTGGYDDDDVIAVSRIFTGWTYDWVNQAQVDTQPRDYVFEFRADRHDFEDKEIPFLGITITGREGPEGVEEGDELIDALAMDPRTQNYVCGKIVQKFVADQPPASFVSNCVAAWEASGGNSAAILRAILLDPAYINTPAIQRNQSKTPLEFAVSFARAFDYLPSADQEDRYYRELREMVSKAGYFPVRFPVPTGLPEVGAAWLNSGSLISQYQEVVGMANNAANFGSDLQSLLLEAGLATAEEAAAYMLAVATADRYREDEFNAVVQELKGTDGFFEPATEDESRALRRAIGLIGSMPSFHLQ